MCATGLRDTHDAVTGERLRRARSACSPHMSAATLPSRSCIGHRPRTRLRRLGRIRGTPPGYANQSAHRPRLAGRPRVSAGRLPDRSGKARGTPIGGVGRARSACEDIPAHNARGQPAAPQHGSPLPSLPRALHMCFPWSEVTVSHGSPGVRYPGPDGVLARSVTRRPPPPQEQGSGASRPPAPTTVGRDW